MYYDIHVSDSSILYGKKKPPMLMVSQTLINLAAIPVMSTTGFLTIRKVIIPVVKTHPNLKPRYL